jgi:hypothetical protein
MTKVLPNPEYTVEWWSRIMQMLKTGQDARTLWAQLTGFYANPASADAETIKACQNELRELLEEMSEDSLAIFVTTYRPESVVNLELKSGGFGTWMTDYVAALKWARSLADQLDIYCSWDIVGKRRGGRTPLIDPITGWRCVTAEAN